MKTLCFFILGLFLGVISSSAQPTVVYVNQNSTNSVQDGTSWATAVHELSAALNGFVGDGSPESPYQVWVATGTYKPTDGTDRTASFNLLDNVEIIGGFVGTEVAPQQRYFRANGQPQYPTVLSGDIGVPQSNPITATNSASDLVNYYMNANDPGFADNSLHVITSTSRTGVVLDGLTITGGNASVSTNEVSPLLFLEMTQPAGIYGETLALLDSRVAGGGVNFSGGDIDFTGVFYDNLFGGGPDNLLITNCIFVGNAAGAFGGAVAANSASVQIDNTQFLQNQAGYEGGAFWGQSQLDNFSHCYFQYNWAYKSGGAVQLETIPNVYTVSGYENFDYTDTFSNVLSSEQSYMANMEFTFETMLGKLAYYGELGQSSSGPVGYANNRVAIEENLANAGESLGQSILIALAKQTDAGGALYASFVDLVGANAADVIGVYGQIGAIITLSDIVVDSLTFIPGVNNLPYFDAFINGWNMDYTYFEEYASPGGWATLLANVVEEYVIDEIFPALPGPTYEQQAQALRVADQANYNQIGYNQTFGPEPYIQYRSVFTFCQFETNQTEGCGGAIMDEYDNVTMEDCRFDHNMATLTGGAAMFTCFNQPILVSDAFVGNESVNGTSAVANEFRVEPHFLNCSFLDNVSATNYCALDNELGADTFVGNCIFWGNSNVVTAFNGEQSYRNGADIFTATSATLSSNALSLYDQAGDSHWAWIGMCDVHYSLIQSEGEIVLGKDDFANYDSGVDQLGALIQAQDFNVGQGMRQTLTNLAYGNLAQNPAISGDGVAPLFGSPAINSGYPALLNDSYRNWSITGLDLYGNPRLHNGKVDMGAVEATGGVLNNSFNPFTSNLVASLTNYVPPVVPEGSISNYYINANNFVGGDGSSWNKAYTNFPAIPTNLLVNGTIWVATGTYKPSVPMVVQTGMTVIGGVTSGAILASDSNPEENPTIIDGAGTRSQLMITYTTNQPILVTGLTFENGAQGNSNGVALLEAYGSTVVSNCQFNNNLGTVALGENSSYINCSFNNNQANANSLGILVLYGSVAENCNFSDNNSLPVYASGGGISGCVFESNKTNSTSPFSGASLSYSQIYNCQFQEQSGPSLNATGGSTVEGCTFTEGSVCASLQDSAMTNCEFLLNNLGPADSAVVILSSSSVEDCQFTRSTGLQALATNDSSLSGCLFQSNAPTAAGGVTALNLNNGSAVNCTFASDGGTVAVAGGPSDGQVTFDGCQFVGNTNGASLLSTAPFLTLGNCLFATNSSTNTSVVNLASGVDATIYNSEFFRNSGAGSAGAIYAGVQNFSLFNCTIYSNTLTGTAGQGSAGVDFAVLGQSQCMVMNSIITGNSLTSPGGLSIENQQLCGITSSVNGFIQNSIIQGLTFLPQTASFDANPEFVNPAMGNLTLSNTSPAINRGTVNNDPSLGWSSTDLAGNPRVLNNTIDMGAYEHPPTMAYLPQVSPSYSYSQLCDGLPSFAITASIPSVSLFAGSFQWQVNRLDGNGFVPLTNDTITSGVSSLTILLTRPPTSIGQYLYRIISELNLGLVIIPTNFVLPPFNSIIYVNQNVAAGTGDGTSWANAMTSLSTAVFKATSCGQIWVAQGIYTATPGGFSPFDSIQIYGGFSGHESNLSQRNWAAYPTYLQSSTTPVISTEPGITSATLIDGFYILYTGRQEAIVLESSPVIQNCIFSNCTAPAIVVETVNSTNQVLINQCQFLNGTGTGIFNNVGNLLVQHCLFSGGQGVLAGAILTYGRNGSLATITDSQFYNNKGSSVGAIEASDDSSTTILRCAFTNNTGAMAGAILVDSGANMVLGSSLLAGNQSGNDGGGIFYSGNSLNVGFCTMADNIAPGQGGGLYLTTSGWTVESSILWNNKGGSSVFAAQFDNQSSQAIGNNVRDTFIQGAPVTTQDPRPYDPLFLNEPLGNYQLNTNSPAVNIGTYPTGIFAGDATDLLGTPRPTPGRGSDLGCYELVGLPAQNQIVLLAEPTNVTTCPISAASFSIIGFPGFPNYYQWQQFNGTSFVNINSTPQAQILANQNTNTLFIPNAGNFNGAVFRVSVNNGAYLTQPVTLTAPPEPVVYVNAAAGPGGNGTSWASAYQSLTAAVEATSCAEIWVAQGTYVGGNNLQLSSTLQIYGGFNGSEWSVAQRDYVNNVTTLVPDASGNTVVAYNSVSNSALLDGFYLTGSTNGTPGSPAAALLALNGQPTIQNCVFISNAMAVDLAYSSGLQMSNCVFADNTGAYTFLAQDSTNLSLTDCDFTNNSGTIFLLDQCSAGLTNCQFINNPGAEALSSVSSALALERCQFNRNGTAIDAYAGTVTMLDSLVSGNQTYESNVVSTAILASDTPLMFVNDTIADNFGGGVGEGVYLEGGSLNAYNCIFWGNTSSSLYYTTEQLQVYGADAGIFVSHSLVQGLEVLQDAGRDDIYFAPIFVNEPAGNYQLASVSPAIGAGTTAHVSASDTDFLGQPRIHGGLVDMGACAFAGTVGPAADLAYNFSSENVCVGSSAVFSVTNLGAGSMSVAWLVNTGGGFAPAPTTSPYAIASSGNESALTVSGVNEGFNDTQFEFVLSGSVDYTSAPVTVTIAQQSEVYVDAHATGANNGASWTDAFTNLAPAIQQGGACTAIYVAQGTYTLNDPVNLAPGVEIEGGFPTGGGAISNRNPALYATIVQSSPIYEFQAVFSQAYPEPPGQHTILDGLVFPGGKTQSAFYCTAGSPQVLNCVISNFPSLALASFQSSMYVSNCVLCSNNVAVYGLEADLQMSHCTVSNNANSAVIPIGSQLTAADCTFVNNTNVYGNGGAIDLEPFEYFSGSGATVERCVFSGNSAGSGGGAINIDTYGSLNLMDSLVYNNSTAEFGGAIDNGGTLTAINCTIANNFADWGGSALYSAYAYATLNNCIIWDTIDGTAVPYGTIAASYCDFAYDPFGAHSFTANPFFANAAAGDYTLAARSPAIDAGNNADVQSGDTDLAGHLRIQDGTVDLGAFESSLARNAVLVASEPQSTNVCVGDPAQFLVVGGPTNAYQWQYNLGLGWTDLTNGGSIAGSTVSISTNLTGDESSSTLSLAQLSTNLNGLTVQVVFVGQAYTSTVASLTIPANTIIYVDASASAGGDGKSWATAYGSLVDAINTASACQPEIRVAEGTYGASGTFAGTYSGYHDIYIPEGLMIYGGFPTGGGAMSARDWTAHPTILTNAGGYPVVQFDGQYNNSIDAETTLLDGFIIEGNGISPNGVEVIGAAPTLQNLTVRDCAGSGLTAQSASSHIIHCTFVNNQTGGNGGGLSLIASPVTLLNCVVRANSAGGQGGGVSLVESGATLLNCVVQGNSASGIGGGIYAQNDGYYDAGYYNVQIAPDQLLDILLTGNWASSGGGLYAAGQATVVNSTIAGNYGATEGGGVVESSATMTMVNSIVWGNRSDPTNSAATALTEEQQQVASDFPGLYALIFSLANDDIEGLHTLTGGALVNQDPIFDAPLDAGSAPSTNGNFQWAGCSPLFGAGNAGYDSAISLDLTGQPRLTADQVDLGPYQVGSGSATPLLITAQPQSLVYELYSTNMFAVAATGDGLTYQWELAAPGGVFVPVQENAIYSGATAATIELTQPPLNLNGSLVRCVVTSSEGCVAVTEEAALKIYPTRYYVNAAMPDDSGDGQTWATAFKTLPHALALPCDPSGTEIWCAAGAYQGAPMQTGQLLYGGFNGTETNRTQRNWTANLTVLNPSASYSPGYSPLAAVIFTLPQSTYNPYDGTSAITPLSLGRIDGFQMSGANSAIVWTSGYDNASELEEGATNVTVANCTFTNCDAAVYGSAALTTLALTNDLFQNTGIALQFASALVQNSGFTGGSSGLNVQNGNVTVMGSVFSGIGTALALTSSGSATVTDSQFQSNSTAIHVDGASTLLVQRTAVRGNTGPNAVMVGGFLFPTATFEDCLFSGNANAGAMDSSGSATFRNCTFAGNGGAGVTTSGPGQAGFALYNCIVWDNGAPNNATATDPYFAAPISPASAPTISGDFHLTPCSPLIASGQTAQIGTSTTDLDGLPRLFDGTVTPGAYEPESSLLTISVQPANVVAISGQTASLSAQVATTNGAAFNWQMSIGGGAFTNLPNAAPYSGVTTTNLSFAASATENGNAYRLQATYSSGCSLESEAATFTYIVPALTEAGAVPNGLLEPGVNFTFSLPNGVDPATINDQSIAAYGSESGRLSFGNGALAVNGSTINLNPNLHLHPGEQVYVTINSSLLSSQGFPAIPQTWEFFNDVSSWDGAFSNALPINAASSYAANLVQAGDLNGDGSIDLFVSTSTGCRILTNSGAGSYRTNGIAGTFSDSGQNLGSVAASKIVLGNVRGSGLLDAVLLRNGDIEVWTNSDAGVFALAATYSVAATDFALGDLNNDGEMDLFVLTQTNAQVWWNTGAGSFANAGISIPETNAASVALGDFNGDGNLDAYVVHSDSTAGHLWLNQGDETFALGAGAGLPSTVGGYQRVVAGNLLNSGQLDLVAMTNGTAQIWAGHGDGSFTYYCNVAAENPNALCVGDINGDRKGDLLVAASGAAIMPEVSVSFPPSDGRQALGNQGAIGNATAAVMADLNGDGALDLVLVSPSGQLEAAIYQPVNLWCQAEPITSSYFQFTDGAFDDPFSVLGYITSGVKFDTVPANGQLVFDYAAITAGEEIDYNDYYGPLVFAYIPNNGFSGIDSFTWRGVDGVVLPHEFTFNISVAPQLNVVATNQYVTVAAGQSVSGLTNGATSILSGDLDYVNQLALIAVAESQPQHGTLLLFQDGTFTYTQTGVGAHADSFNYFAQDRNSGVKSLATVFITITNVNDTPNSITLVSNGVYESQPVGTIAGYLAAQDPDPSVPGITYSLVSGPGATDNDSFVISSNVLYTAASFSYADGATRSILVQATGQPDTYDATGSSSTQVILVNILPLPQAFPQSLQAYENSNGLPVTLTGTGVLPLHYVVVNQPTHGTLSGTSPNLTYLPNTNFFGTDTIGFEAADGVMTSAVGQISITVNFVDEAPAAPNMSVNVLENTPTNFVLTASPFSTNEVLSYQLSTNYLVGQLMGTPPNLTYVPPANYHEVAYFNYTASENGLTSPMATVYINIQYVEQPPLAKSETNTVAENGSTTITLFGYDPQFSNATIRVVSQPLNGTVTLVPPQANSEAVYIYKPNENFNGTDTFTYVANNGLYDSLPATVTMMVTPMPVPVALAQSVVTLENQSVSVTLTSSNATANLGNLPATYSVVSWPKNGSLTTQFSGSSNYVYAPEGGYFGLDSFSFVAYIGGFQSTTNTVTIDVQPAAPSATSMTVTNHNGSLVGYVPINFQGSDPNFLPLSYIIVTPPTNGILATNIVPNASFVGYIPSNLNAYAPDYFTFVASDGYATSAVVSVTIVGQEDPHQPEVTPVATNSFVGIPVTIPLSLLAFDDYGDPVTIVGASGFGYGTATYTSNTITFMPTNALSSGSFVESGFTFTVSNYSETASGTSYVGIYPRQILVNSYDPVNGQTAYYEPTLDAAIAFANSFGPGLPWLISVPIFPFANSVALTNAEAVSSDGSLSAFDISGNICIAPIYLQPEAVTPSWPTNLILTAQGSALSMRLFQVESGATLVLSNCLATAGSATLGGAIYSEGGVELENSVVSSNAAASEGGAIYSLNGSVEMTNSLLTGNTAEFGGGFYQLGNGQSASLVASNSIISGNFATNDLVSTNVDGGMASVTSTLLTVGTQTSPSFDMLAASYLVNQGSVAKFSAMADPAQFQFKVTPSAPWGDASILNVNGVGSQRSLVLSPAETAAKPAQNISVTLGNTNLSYTENFTLAIDPNAHPVPVTTPFYVMVFDLYYPVTIPVLQNVVNVSGSPLTVVSVGAAQYGSTSTDGTNIYYTAQQFFASTDSFTYQVSDGVNTVTGIVYANRGFYSADNPYIASGADGGAGSLRAEIDFRGSNYVSGGTQITLSTNLDIDLTSADDLVEGPSAFVIQQNVTIYGNGATIQLDPSASPMRFFHVLPGATLTLVDLTLTGGTAAPSPYGEGDGGAIYNEGVVNLQNVTILNCQAEGETNSLGLGGAIFNLGSVTLDDVSLTNNVASLGGGIFQWADGTSVSVEMTNSIFSNPESGDDLSAIATNNGSASTLAIGSQLQNPAQPWVGAESDFVANNTMLLPIFIGEGTNPISVTAISENTNVVPATNMTFTGTGGLRQLTITPSHNGIDKLDIQAALGGISFTRQFKMYVNNEAPLTPVAPPEQYTVYRGLSSLLAVLTNDSDPGGAALAIVSASAPTNGSVIVTNNEILYLNNDDSATNDYFTYVITNNLGGSTMGTVSLSIIPAVIQVTSASSLGEGSLNAAVSALAGYGDSASNWTISISPNLAGQTLNYNQYGAANGDYTAFDITSHVRIDGSAAPGFTITVPAAGYEGPPLHIFRVEGNGFLELFNLTLLNGDTYNLGSPGSGFGGAIYNEGQINISNVTFNGNTATGYGGNAGGGAVCNDGGAAQFVNCLFENNAVVDAPNSEGGAIFNRDGVLTLVSNTFLNNSASQSAGVCNYAEAVTTITGSGPTGAAEQANLTMTGNGMTNSGGATDVAGVSVNGGTSDIVSVETNAINSIGAPFINTISDETLPYLTFLPFAYTASAGATFSAFSSNATVLPNANLLVSGNAGSGVLTLIPGAEAGTDSVAVQVTDGPLSYAQVFQVSASASVPFTTVPFTATPTNGTVPQLVTFQSPSVDSINQTIVAWNWNFGDGSTSTLQNPTHTYANIGSYTPSLLATNSDGQLVVGFGAGSINLVYPALPYTVNPTNGVAPALVQFTSPSKDSGGAAIDSWNWSFGDGSFSALPNPTHLYTNAGTYALSLQAANVLGQFIICSGPTTLSVVSPSAQYAAYPVSGVAPINVQFVSPAADTGGNAILSWTWNFGDGTGSTQSSPSHVYSAPGNYNVTLTLTNSGGLQIVATGPSTISAGAPLAVLDDYRMGENDPGAAPGENCLTMFDGVGANNLAVTGTAVYSTNVSPAAALLDGSSLSLDLAGQSYGTNQNIAPLANDFCLEAWVYLTNVSDDPVIAYYGDPGQDGWGIGVIDGQWYGLYGDVSFFNDGVAVTLNQWTHVALVCNAGNSTIYVNGAPAGSCGCTPIPPSGLFAIGGNSAPPGQNLVNGLMDEVRLSTFPDGEFTTNALLLNNLAAPSMAVTPVVTVGSTNATITATVNPNGLNSLAWVSYGTTTNFGLQSTLTNVYAGTFSPFGIVLTGLQQGTPYYYAVVASNAYGVVAGDVESFTTAVLSPASQSITFCALANKVYGSAPFPIVASASSGLPVSVAVLSGPATISGSNVTLTGVGRVTIEATQPGNSNYLAAAAVDESFTVGAPVLTVTSTNDAGAGSLRAAVETANAVAIPMLWTIQFDPDLAGKAISLLTADDESFGPSALIVQAQITIDGSGVPGLSVCLGSTAVPMRLIHVAEDGVLKINDLSLENGVAAGGNGGDGGGGGGGGAGFGGGIYNEGGLTLENVTLTNNTATGGHGGNWAEEAAGAGGVPNGGSDPATVPAFGGGSAGSSNCGGGGGLGGGGAIFNNGGIVEMDQCLIVNNSAQGGAGGTGPAGCTGTNGTGLGGGFFNLSGLATLTACVLANNNATQGGGLCNFGGASNSLILDDDTITNANPATTNDLYVNAIDGDLSAVVEANSTIDSQNSPWIAPIADVATIYLGQALSNNVGLHLPGDSTGYTITAHSSDPGLIPDANLFLLQTGTNWILTLQPVAGQSGVGQITVQVSNGTLEASATFTATVGLFANITNDGANLNLNTVADPGLSITVEATTDLSSGTWTILGTAVETTAGHYQFTDTPAASSLRFYRLTAH